MVKIEISNRTMYFLITLGIISIFAIGVFALAPNPGHEVWEVDGVCESDGDNCEGVVGNGNIDVGLFENNDELCYTSSAASSCTTQTETCGASSTTITLSESEGIAPDCSTFESFFSPSERDAQCAVDCSNVPICNGDTTQFSCGAGSTSYTSGSYNGCTDIDFFEIEIECSCSSVATTYQKEIPTPGTMVCLQATGQTPVTVVSAVCDNGEKSRSNNNQIIEEWCGTTLTGLSGCVPFLQFWDYNDNDPDAINELGCKISGNRLYIRTNSAEGDDDELGKFSVCGAVCGANVVIK